MRKVKNTATRENGATIISINPANLGPVGEVKATPPAEVADRVERAGRAFLSWRQTPLKTRIAIIKGAQQRLLDQAEPVAELITREMGRPFTEALALEIEAGLDLLGYYANHGEKFLADRHLKLHNLFFKRRQSMLHLEPLGVLGIISPWNWPLLIPLGGIVPALLSGNAVVFKPSELTPLVGEKIRSLFIGAGLDPEVFQVVQGEAPVGRALVESAVAKIFFTGSTQVGQRVMEQAAGSLKKVVLELGGSDPAVVCPDVDLDMASSGILWGGFCNCGQNCNGIERIFVHEKVAQPFTGLLLDKVARLRVGDGMRADTDIGPLASAAQLKKMESLVDSAKKRGARVLAGGECLTGLPGYFFAPTVIGWDRDIPMPPDEEIFGPLVYITPVRDDQEAVALANRSNFGLAASVWTGDKRRGQRIARALEAGSVMINDVIVSFGMPEVEWTGIKKSAVGWIHGEKGLDEMVNIKYINRDRQDRMQKMWWFPYSENLSGAMRAGMDLLYARQIKKKLKVLGRALRAFAPYLLFNHKRKDKW